MVENCPIPFVTVAGELKDPQPAETAQPAVTAVQATDQRSRAEWNRAGDVLKVTASMQRAGIYEEDGFAPKW